MDWEFASARKSATMLELPRESPQDYLKALMTPLAQQTHKMVTTKDDAMDDEMEDPKEVSTE